MASAAVPWRSIEALNAARNWHPLPESFDAHLVQLTSEDVLGCKLLSQQTFPRASAFLLGTC